MINRNVTIAVLASALLIVGVYYCNSHRTKGNGSTIDIHTSNGGVVSFESEILKNNLLAKGVDIIDFDSFNESFPWHLFPSNSISISVLNSNTPFAIHPIAGNSGAIASINLCLFVPSEKPFVAVMKQISPFPESILTLLAASSTSSVNTDIVFGLGYEDNIYSRILSTSSDSIIININNDILTESSEIHQYETYIPLNYLRACKLLGSKHYFYSQRPDEYLIANYLNISDIPVIFRLPYFEGSFNIIALPNDEIAAIWPMSSADGLYNHEISVHGDIVGAGPIPFDPYQIVFADAFYYYRLENQKVIRSFNRIDHADVSNDIIDNMSALLDYEYNINQSVILPVGTKIYVIDFAKKSVSIRELMQ